MPFWNRKKHWEDEYDEYYAQDRERPSGRRTNVRYLAHLLMLGLLAGLATAAVGLVAGPTMVEKTLTSLVSPLGFVWLGLLVMVYFCLLNRQGWPAMIGFFCWLMLTVGGNQLVSNALIASLEEPFQDINPYESVEGERPFALVVLLGGGTNTTIKGRSQLNRGGDRVAVAARMYHAGRVEKIVCTGSQKYPAGELDLHPREEATNVLLGLGVPNEALLAIKGNNTSEEMKNLKTWLEENQIEGDVGVVTSAWHLPRAIRLAESNGLTVKPIPANFLSEPLGPTPSLIVPDAENLLITAQAIKEHLAGLVGR